MRSELPLSISFGHGVNLDDKSSAARVRPRTVSVLPIPFHIAPAPCHRFRFTITGSRVKGVEWVRNDIMLTCDDTYSIDNFGWRIGTTCNDFSSDFGPCWPVTTRKPARLSHMPAHWITNITST